MEKKGIGKMRKKVLAASLALALAAAMIGGCGNSRDNDTAPEATTTESQAQTTATVDYSQGLNEAVSYTHLTLPTN